MPKNPEKEGEALVREVRKLLEIVFVIDAIVEELNQKATGAEATAGGMSREMLSLVVSIQAAINSLIKANLTLKEMEKLRADMLRAEELERVQNAMLPIVEAALNSFISEQIDDNRYFPYIVEAVTVEPTARDHTFILDVKLSMSQEARDALSGLPDKLKRVLDMILQQLPTFLEKLISNNGYDSPSARWFERWRYDDFAGDGMLQEPEFRASFNLADAPDDYAPDDV